MSRFPTAAHLVSWAKLCPRTIQSGPAPAAARTGKGNPYLKGVLGDAAAAAAKTDTFLGERYRRLVKRRGKLKALVAVARSILVIVWHLLSDPTARFHDLGPDYHTNRIATERKMRNHIAPTHRPGLPGHPRTRRLNPKPTPAQHHPAPHAPPGTVACPLTSGIFPISPHVPSGTPRRRENGLGLPADADVSWAVSPWISLALGPDLEGSRTVASSTPVRISVPGPRPPGDPPWNGWMLLEDKRGEAGTGGDSRHRARADVGAGRRDRRRQGTGKVCVRVPRDRPGRRVSEVWDVAATTGAVTELAEDLVEPGSSGSSSSPPRTIGGSRSTCWRRQG